MIKSNWKFLFNILWITALIVTLLLGIWGCGVFYYLVFSENYFLTGTAALISLALWAAGFFFKRAIWFLLAVQLGVVVYFCCITPEHRFKKVSWQTPWRRRPQAEFHMDKKRITFYDIRDFRYRSENDCDVRYRQETVCLDDVQSVDLALSHWDGMEVVAHSMLCFNFSGNKRIVLSMETRIPEGKTQSALAGFFKQYEIIPLLGTPEDFFDLRIKYRGEDFYLYRLNTTPEQRRRLLLAIACYINLKPEFYNTLTRNCTTSLLPLLDVLELDPIDDFRLIINGFSDQLIFRLGYLHHRKGESFASLKSRSYIPGKNAGTAE